jgi:hypothetical protein
MCRGRNDPRAINQVYFPSESDILPDFGFTWYRCDAAYFSTFEGIDDAGLANVGVSDEAD